MLPSKWKETPFPWELLQTKAYSTAQQFHSLLFFKTRMDIKYGSLWKELPFPWELLRTWKVLPLTYYVIIFLTWANTFSYAVQSTKFDSNLYRVWVIIDDIIKRTKKTAHSILQKFSYTQMSIIYSSNMNNCRFDYVFQCRDYAKC